MFQGPFQGPTSSDLKSPTRPFPQHTHLLKVLPPFNSGKLGTKPLTQGSLGDTQN